MTSCCNEPVDFIPENNNAVALDTLKNYSDYILGDFNGKFLVSTHVFTKGYSVITSMPGDFSPLKFDIGYKLKENNVDKSIFITYRFLEAKIKLDSNYHYKYFSDFINFFNGNQFAYYQLSHPIENIHNVVVSYGNFYTIVNDGNQFITYKYNEQITPENFNFTIDSIKTIENPIKKVEVYYSFKCIGVNDYSDKFTMKNGKGKSTFEWQ